jgi:dTDP-4-dehydrorhamnose 3,5-epimerase
LEFIKTEIPDVLVISLDVFEDNRGFFMETYHARRFAESVLPYTFVQENHSGSRRGTLRGLHYQTRQVQGKLVRVIVGEVYDVVVDLRRRSPTFGKWVGVHLLAEERKQIWIPPGFAHGFYTLSEWAEMIYMTTDFYAPQWERTLLWNDPQIGIQWPLLENLPLLMSEKDRAGLTLDKADIFEELL